MHSRELTLQLSLIRIGFPSKVREIIVEDYFPFVPKDLKDNHFFKQLFDHMQWSKQLNCQAQEI